MSIRVSEICRVVMPLAYIEMIFWSMSEMSFCRFFTTFGSNVDFLSCGTSIRIDP
jgi:hypothetical protein